MSVYSYEKISKAYKPIELINMNKNFHHFDLSNTKYAIGLSIHDYAFLNLKVFSYLSQSKGEIIIRNKYSHSQIKKVYLKSLINMQI